MSSSTFNINNFLRDAKVQAYLFDQIETSLKSIDELERLDFCADVCCILIFSCMATDWIQRDFAVDHYHYTEDSEGVWILCHRDGDKKGQEATFFFSGPLYKHSTMPYNHFKESVSL